MVGVLRRAADTAGCCAHLGVVHIEESGPAEPHYLPSRGRGYRGYRDDFDDDDDIDAAGVEYEVIEVSDGDRYIDHWIAGDGQMPGFGRLPLADGELLPAGALDDEPPDEDRLLEATGNEGVSFERAYRRAALILWPQASQIEVLLQAGVGAALPALETMLAAGAPNNGSPALHAAGRIVTHWAQQDRPRGAARHEAPLRVRMLRYLVHFGQTAPGERFLNEVLVADYDGTENPALVDAAQALAAQTLDRLLGALVEAAFPRCPRALCELLFLLEAANLTQLSAGHGLALRRFAAALVDALPRIAARPSRDKLDWRQAYDYDYDYDETAADADSCHRLLSVLERLVSEEQYGAAVAAVIARPQVFDPGRVLLPALQALCATADGGGIGINPQRLRLWRHCCAFLLARSEFPPAMPLDWSQPVALPCRCEDCRALEAFARDPLLREQRFRVRKDRRQHLHGQIQHHALDMSHVTERSGSPQTLVCRKTREGYRRQCRQHAEDVAGMRALGAMGIGALEADCARLAAAAAREPEAVEG